MKTRRRRRRSVLRSDLTRCQVGVEVKCCLLFSMPLLLFVCFFSNYCQSLLSLLSCLSIFHHLTNVTLRSHPASLLCKALLVVFTLSTATTCFPPLRRSSVSRCVHASVALQANTVAFRWPRASAHSGVPRAISAEPNCSPLFVFKVSILNKHVPCK